MYYSDFDGGDEYWNDPANPNRVVPNSDEVTERYDTLGSFVTHLTDNEKDDLHQKVHDSITNWLAGRIPNGGDVPDEVRMASHCLSNTFLHNLEQMEEMSDEDLYRIFRMCIQIGYAMKTDENSGDLQL